MDSLTESAIEDFFASCSSVLVTTAISTHRISPRMTSECPKNLRDTLLSKLMSGEVRVTL